MSKVSNAEVIARHNENPERLIRRFIKKCKRAGFLDEVRQRRFHEKKSDKRRRKKAEAEYRRQRDLAKAEKASKRKPQDR
jgi:ribosomal protein S21